MRALTMKNILKEIIKNFRIMYGFAPDKKDIVPLESSGYEEDGEELYDYLEFAVGGRVYVYIPEDRKIYVNTSYDMFY